MVRGCNPSGCVAGRLARPQARIVGRAQPAAALGARERCANTHAMARERGTVEMSDSIARNFASPMAELELDLVWLRRTW